MLLEGTASLYFAKLFLPNLQAAFKIFIEVEQDILLKRRIKRDLIERGYADEESIIAKDAEHVRPTFFQLIEPTKAFADIVIINQETPYLKNPFVPWIEEITELLKDQLVNFK